MPRRPRRPRPSRYVYEQIVLRIERMRVACGVEAKEVYLAIGLPQPSWSRKMAGASSRFSVEDLGSIADFFSAHTGRALLGWPLVDAEVSDVLERRARI